MLARHSPKRRKVSYKQVMNLQAMKKAAVSSPNIEQETNAKTVSFN